MKFKELVWGFDLFTFLQFFKVICSFSAQRICLCPVSAQPQLVLAEGRSSLNASRDRSWIKPWGLFLATTDAFCPR